MGVLYIVPTPIGNLKDITIRALEVLFSVPFIACEDTRKTGMLMRLLKEKYGNVIPVYDVIPGGKPGIQGKPRWILNQVQDDKNGPRDDKTSPQLISYYEQNELQRIPEVLTALQNGFDVALVSDAGTPLISDPGFKLVRACREAGIPIVSLPGASSVNVALTSSGLPSDKYFFLGYPPYKSGHRQTFFQNIKQLAVFLSATFILFEAPHKVRVTLEEMEENLGDIEIVICRELTKLHEEVWSGKISEARKEFTKRQPRGEFVILLHL